MLRAPQAKKLLGEPQDQLSDLKKKIARLLRKDGKPKDYVELYYEIPAFMKDMRSRFYADIFDKAKSAGWTISKFADITSQIY